MSKTAEEQLDILVDMNFKLKQELKYANQTKEAKTRT
jgi:hypothetical protein